MDFNVDDYDIYALREYFSETLNNKEDYYGTAMMNGQPFATVDLIDVDIKYNVNGLSDYEVLLKAQQLGILEDFHKEKRY